MSEDTRSEIDARIDALEASYEFFLAYAAQGVSGDAASKQGGQLREFLEKAEAALTGLGDAFRAHVDAADLGPDQAWADILDVLTRDAGAARAAVALVRTRPSISSQLVDNLNANIHLRATLTDLFLLDEALG
ncbi:MAG: hypothetical protein RH859_06305 [Longimicrobiales bacterium]